MSLLSRVSAPAAVPELADLVAGLLSHASRRSQEGQPEGQQEGLQHRVLHGPVGLGTASARFPPAGPAVLPVPPARHAESGTESPQPPSGPTGLGTSSLRVTAPARRQRVPELYCPPPLRDDPALAEEVNDRLIGWAAETGIYPGRLDQLRSTSFGRFIMLTHPDTDDADRLLAAAKCAVAEWAADDHYCDDESAGSRPAVLAARLGVAYAAADPAQMPARYRQDLEQQMLGDPVRVALRSGIAHLSRYASHAQVNRLRHELAMLFVAFDAEASWRATGHTPAVVEYLIHRQQNSFLPCIGAIDAIGGYEVPAEAYAHPRVRGPVLKAALAATLVNDLYSLARQSTSNGADFDLPSIIAAQEGCSLAEGVARTVDIHDELVRDFETEAAVLAADGSPAVLRFMAGVWAWLGGNLAWHSSSERYG
ncbi:family 2 encapsulin nanocompartment cargo protein terpene cyclase [Longispora albida]|uniref:family 2 encapsulin nanocompartment cargo protein terpene cyclase n=1 Tax=Longispora albida TaxID=203523 RepID=UPI0003A78897|nr:family 2 encapsulin nanocompartment cargo protein terpene cyclase [Longispora albida]